MKEELIESIIVNKKDSAEKSLVETILEGKRGLDQKEGGVFCMTC